MRYLGIVGSFLRMHQIWSGSQTYLLGRIQDRSHYIWIPTLWTHRLWYHRWMRRSILALQQGTWSHQGWIGQSHADGICWSYMLPSLFEYIHEWGMCECQVQGACVHDFVFYCGWDCKCFGVVCFGGKDCGGEDQVGVISAIAIETYYIVRYATLHAIVQCSSVVWYLMLERRRGEKVKIYVDMRELISTLHLLVKVEKIFVMRWKEGLLPV